MIPDPDQPPRLLATNSGTLTLDETSNFALQVAGATVFFQDGDDIKGNAANSGTMAAAGEYTVDFDVGSPVIHGPVGASGALAISLLHPEVRAMLAFFFFG